MTKPYDLLVFIGRFQPFHKGHQEVIDHARTLAKNVLVLVGSAGIARSTRNPFTFEERANLIKEINPDLIVLPIHDHTYNDPAWIREVQQQVKRTLLGDKWTPDGLNDFKIGIIGCDKDETTYYLNMFPDWGREIIPFISPLNATAFRKELFESALHPVWEETNLHKKTQKFLVEFQQTDAFRKLRANYKQVIKDKATYGEGPHLTADSLVQVGGKILLVTRGKEYGHGLMAMPGGFVKPYEKFLDAAIRELREETVLKVPVPVLKGSIKSFRMFDDPHRSERGRLVTVCYHFNLANDTKLPEVRGSDDADKADWYDIDWILENRELFFEDHYAMIKVMLGVT